MSFFGMYGLVIAFAAAAISVIAGIAGTVLSSKGTPRAATVRYVANVGTVLSALALTFCCGILVYCLVAGDYSIQYVLDQHSNEEGILGLLYKVSGLWAGREGSLLFWAWVISLCSATLVRRTSSEKDGLHLPAMAVVQTVLALFLAVCLFSPDNQPFYATSSQYLDADGNLVATTSLGMNTLLQHWAMAIHPPTLFIGYAALTVPFAYAVAALATGRTSREWAFPARRYATVAWLFLGIGVALGALWAYVCLGWGGYWGWDPVENASLLSWLMALALIHSLTVLTQRGRFAKWSIVCACLTFSFVIVGTFISRSGLVQSVHAFEGDAVSLALFGLLIVVSALIGIVGVLVRSKSFEPEDDIQSFASKDAAYYFNNVIMLVATVVLAYLTIASALPTWLPFGGQSLSAGTYNAFARPLSVLYAFILAVCPLLSWVKTDRAAFLKRAKVPGICALALFALLMAYFVTTLLPVYTQAVASGGTAAQDFLEQGPDWYYNGLAVLGLAAASLLLFNALFIFARTVASVRSANGEGSLAARLRALAPRIGGFFAHAGIAVVLVGLIGSSMYVTEETAYVASGESMQVGQYSITLDGAQTETDSDSGDVTYSVQLSVTQGEEAIVQMEPSIQLSATTMQQKSNAAVYATPLHDLFVVYQGVNDAGEYSLDVRINPLVSFVWVGAAMMLAGTAFAAFGRRREV